MLILIKIYIKDFLEKRNRKKLIKRIYLDDRVPSSSYLDKV